MDMEPVPLLARHRHMYICRQVTNLYCQAQGQGQSQSQKSKLDPEVGVVMG